MTQPPQPLGTPATSTADPGNGPTAAGIDSAMLAARRMTTLLRGLTPLLAQLDDLERALSEFVQATRLPPPAADASLSRRSTPDQPRRFSETASDVPQPGHTAARASDQTGMAVPSRADPVAAISGVMPVPPVVPVSPDTQPLAEESVTIPGASGAAPAIIGGITGALGTRSASVHIADVQLPNVQPARLVTFTISNPTGTLDLSRVHRAIEAVPGVTGLVVTSYTRGRAQLLLNVAPDVMILPLADALADAFPAGVQTHWHSDTEFEATVQTDDAPDG